MIQRSAVFLLVLILVSHQVGGYDADEISTFVAPDNSFEALSSFLESVDSFLYLSVYQISSPDVAREITELLQEGKNVTILVDESPAGGFPDLEKPILSMLVREGAGVYLGSPEYRFNHAKYGVADNETLFLTSENIGQSGFPASGESGNRGWGVVVEDAELSTSFVNIFYSDLKESEPFLDTSMSFSQDDAIVLDNYDPEFIFEEYSGSYPVVTVIAPENAVEKIVSLIESANESLYIEQFYVYKYWGKPKTGSVSNNPNLFLESSIDAARRGVSVKILLDDTWYNIEEDDPISNLNTMRYVNGIAKNEGLDLEARLIDSDNLGIEKLHVKGAVVDEKAVLVSSINWNENSPTNNREAGLIIYGEPAEYFAKVFEHDWGEVSETNDNNIELIAIFGILVFVFLLRRRKH